MHQRFAVSSVVLATLVFACAKGPKVEKTDPFLVAREDVRPGIKVVALAPITIPEGLPEPDPIKDKFLTRIESKLKASGLSVVRPYEYTRTWNKYVEDFGAIVDPNTGERNESSLVTATVRTLDDLKAGFDVDAIVIPSVVVVKATFMGGKAWWDGTSQRIQTSSPVSEFLSGGYEGVVSALSLRVSIWTPDGTHLYLNAGGIEALSVAEGAEFSPVPRQSLFTDEAKINKAVDIALDPFTKK